MRQSKAGSKTKWSGVRGVKPGGIIRIIRRSGGVYRRCLRPLWNCGTNSKTGIFVADTQKKRIPARIPGNETGYVQILCRINNKSSRPPLIDLPTNDGR